VARAQSTVALALTDLTRQTQRSRVADVTDLIARARGLRSNGGGSAALDVAEACIAQFAGDAILRKDKVKSARLQASSKAAFDHPELPTRWKGVAWATAHRLNERFEQATVDETRFSSDAEAQSLSGAERFVLGRVYTELALAWLKALEKGFKEERDGPYLVECWSQAREFSLQRARHLRIASDTRRSAELDAAFVLLVARQADEAQALLAPDPTEGRRERVRARREYLEAECVLIQTEKVPNKLRLKAVLERVEGWTAERNNPARPLVQDLWCLRAALERQLGWLEAFHLSLTLASPESGVSLEPHWSAVPWRSPEQTRLEAKGLGWRRLLQRALDTARAATAHEQR
jgi:hypothetical protein